MPEALWKGLFSPSTRVDTLALSTLRSTLFLPERGRVEGQSIPLIRGVILDVPVNHGLDTLAGYADGTARYLNHSGRVIIWEAPNSHLQPLIESLLAQAAPLLSRASRISYGQSPEVPTNGQPQATFLGKTSLHVVQLSGDEESGRLLGAGVALMQGLIRAGSQA